MNFKYTNYLRMLKSAVSFLLIQVLLASVWQQASLAQTPSACTTEGLLMGWNFDVIKTDCPGGSATRQFKSALSGKAALFYQDQAKYCPNINNGCGTGLLGSKGHNNTPEFANAICLINFYNPTAKFFGYYGAGAPYDPNSTVFDPLGAANLYVTYTVPAGKASCFTGFALKIIQATQATAYGAASASPSFEKQGVAVYRNGVQIYNSTQPISASNVNGTPMRFNFSGTEFCTDGSQAVTFTVYFGLVHRLAVVTTGYDDLMLYGTCGGPVVTAAATPATCGTSGGINSDGKITLSGFSATNKYDYTPGNTYTGSATYATATAIPANGVIVSNLPDPAVAKTYTIRVFDASGCYRDVTVTLTPSICAPVCTPPGSVALAATLATCNGTTPANNASITVSGVVGGDKVGISAGATYTGPTYTSATALTGGGYTFANLPNPVGNQLYTVRVFNGSNTCYIDKTIVLDENTCTPCKNAVAQIKTSGAADPDSKPNNSIASEDDQVTYQVCTNPQTIDLKLTKTVTPNTGTTCPVSTTFTWTLTLTNAGSMSATNIQVADYLPLDKVQLISATPSAGTYALNGGWQLASLGAGQSATLRLVTIALSAGTIQNCAEVMNAFPLNDPNSTPGNGVTTEDDYACATITVTGPNIPELSKEFSPMQTRPNVPTRLTLKIVNNESTGITLTANLVDTLAKSPGQMVIAPNPNVTTTNGVGVVALAGGTSFYIPSGTVLPPGLTQISLDVVMPVAGMYCNTIKAGTLQTTSCRNLQDAQACIDVNDTFVIPPVLSKTFSSPVLQVNQVGSLTITVENKNSSSMTLAGDFRDYLPTGLVLAAGTNTGTCTGVQAFAAGDTVITMVSGSVIPSGTCTIVVPVKSATAGTYCNEIAMNALIVNVGGKQVGNQEYPTSCLNVVPNPVFDLALIKTLTAGQSRTVTAGSSVTFTVTVSNQGSVDATNVQVTDYIPTGLTLADPNWTASGTKATLNTPIASLLAGQSTTRTIVFTVNTTAAGSLTNTAEISSASNSQNLQDKDSTPDNDPTNDGTPLNDNASGDHKNYPSQDEDDSDPEEITVTPLACLGDYVWLDANQNGQQDSGETGVSSVTVVLYDATTNTVVSTTVTDGTGKYLFCGLNPGQYYVKFTAPSGMTFTTANSGNDATDSDAGINGQTGNYTLTAGQTDLTVDAGLIPLKACLGDYVWLDNNQNGQQDAGETGVSSVTVVLYDATTNTVVSTTVTDATGKYLFCGLNPGQYYVKFTAPSGMTFTTANSGNDATDSDAGTSGQTGNYTLTAGQTDLTVDAGLVPLKACLGDYVWLDANQNGQQDPSETGVSSVTVVLYDATTNTVVSTTVTDATGKYLFCGLNPGQYYVKFTAPSGMTFTTANSGNDATDSDAGTSGQTGNYTLTAGQTDLTVDAGLVPLKAALGDYVWYDNNKNGQQDPGEPPAVGVTVTLYDATTNQSVSTMVTDATGHYLFSNLNPGTYYVVFTAPSGSTFTTANSGNDATDSDAGVGGKTGNYTLAAGQVDLTVDAGLVPQCTSPNCFTSITVK